MNKQKVLIIKTGYSEILEEQNNSRVVSYGDILRITPLLHLYKKDHVTWITDKKAFPLLKNIPLINRLLPFDCITIKQLEKEKFDTCINLEKIPGICALANDINAWKKFGFRFDTESGSARPYDKAFGVLALSSNPKIKKENKKTSQELLFNMVDEKWQGEEYVLGYTPKTQEKYDVGLNTLVGPKWPTKLWPVDKWNQLEELLIQKGLKITRQDKQSKEILENLEKYMDWINSSKIIVSNDSLGLHLAIALKKKEIGLFGPTPYAEFHFYGRGKAILPKPMQDCIPCFSRKCKKKKKCIEDISPKRVYEEVNLLYKTT